MAFEDRSSPSTGTSPNPRENSITAPNSPESARFDQYTCTTIQPKQEPNVLFSSNFPQEQEKTFLRIASYALPSPQDCDSSRDTGTPSSCNQNMSRLSSCGDSNHSEDSTGPMSPRDVEEQVPVIQTLKYSIRNILQPDFGKSAVLKTKAKTKIGFRPYDIKEDFTSRAPLGSLCQTVSQIGKSVKQTEAAIRPSSPKILTGDENKKEEGKVPTLWPAWVYCTRYSDRPSSGKY